MPSEIQIEAAAVRRAMHDRGVSPDATWRITIRGGPSGAALRRALNGGTLARSTAEDLARALHVRLDDITAAQEGEKPHDDLP